MTIQQMLLATSGGDGSVEFDFTGISSLPSELYDRKANVSGLTQTVSFVTAGLSIAGNAPNDGNSYPIAINTSFTEDYLFQMSTRIDIDPSGSDYCSDAGIALFLNSGITANLTSTSWIWKWGFLNGRIAAQNNCPEPYLYGQSSDVKMTTPNSGKVLISPYVSSGDFVTMHLRHLPSQSKTTYKVTVGSKDWNELGTVLGSGNTGNQSSTGILDISDHFGSSSYHVGIGGDDDSDATIINGFRYQKL